MIRGIGVDTVDIDRFARLLDRTPALLGRLFAPAERALGTDSLAARFAAKEALIKALGGSGSLRWIDMEVVRGPERAPRFAPAPRLIGELEGRGVDRLYLSLAHDGGIATAFVIAEGAAGD